MDLKECSFEELDFFDSLLEGPEKSGACWTFRVSNAQWVPTDQSGYPLEARTLPPFLLVLEGVGTATCSASEYRENGALLDAEASSFEYSNESKGRLRSYHLEGRQKRPPAWVSWQIEAGQYRLEVFEE